MTSDLDLLRRFARENAQDAFAEVVRRHLNLVFSAALRQVRSPQLAEEVAQSVFADLARNARKLKPDTILPSWLYSVTRRTAIDAIRKESRRRLREQTAVEMNDMNATANDWTQIAPLLDDAMAALDETDRSAILLRYFENKNLREVGESLGTSDDVAQKRVSRAVERLREFFSKRNVTIGASGLAVLISANGVQSAPVGLSAVILTVITGTTKTLGLTMIQKLLITGITATAVGSAVYVFHLQSQNGSLQQQQAMLGQQIEQLSRERDEATNQLAGLQQENKQLRVNEPELLKLRSEVTRLQRLPSIPPRTAQAETVNADPDPIDIHTKARFISIPSEDLGAMGIAWMSDAQGNKTGMLTEQQFKVIREAMQGASDVETIAEPEVIASKGQQTQMQITRAVFMNGTNADVGEWLDITANFSTNTSTFNLNLCAKLNQLTGDPSQPELQAIQITNRIVLSPGQTVALETEIPNGGWLPEFTNILAGPRSLLIFVTPALVNDRDFQKPR